MKRKAKDYYKDSWVDIFRYDPSSPSGLSWKGRQGERPAGWQCPDGRWKVEYLHKPIQVHRVVYFLNHLHLHEDYVVDHIDQNPSNNRIDNLRLVESKLNSRNKKKSHSNTSGTTGVYEVHEWVATWSEDGRNRSKGFKVSKYGDRAREEAEIYRAKKIESLNKLGYGYTNTHGENL